MIRALATHLGQIFASLAKTMKLVKWYIEKKRLKAKVQYGS